MVASGLAWASVRAADSGEPELITDRPDQTESAVVVPAGTVQVEAGALLTLGDEGEVRTGFLAGPGTLLRFGVVPRLELRVAWPGWIDEWTRGGEGRSVGTEVGDPELGVKVALAAERGMRPELALLVHVSLPVGGEVVGSPRADPSVLLAAAHTFSDHVGLGWNLGWEVASYEDAIGQVHTLARVVYAASLGFDLTERWGAFVEIFGDLPASDPAPTRLLLDAGITFRVAPRVQLDLSAGVGVNGDPRYRFVGLGASFRVPR